MKHDDWFIANQFGDAPLPWNRRTRHLQHEPIGPVVIIASVIVMTFAVFGAIALASGWVP